MMTTCAKPAEAVCWNFTQDPSTSGKFCLRCGHGAECHLEGAHRAVAEWGGHDIDIAAYGSPEHCREKFKEVSDGADATAGALMLYGSQLMPVVLDTCKHGWMGEHSWHMWDDEGNEVITYYTGSLTDCVPFRTEIKLEPSRRRERYQKVPIVEGQMTPEQVSALVKSIFDNPRRSFDGLLAIPNAAPSFTGERLRQARARERLFAREDRSRAEYRAWALGRFPVDEPWPYIPRGVPVPIVYGQRRRSRMSGLGPDLEAWSWERELPRLKAMDPNSIEDLGEQPAEPDDLKCERPGCYIQWPHTCNRLA